MRHQHTLISDAVPVYEDGFPIIPLRRKLPVSAWKHLQTERPGLPETVASLCARGVDGFGVPHWQGLVCRDYDEHGAYDKWRTAHPALAAELPTVCTSRGMRVYATAADACYVSHRALGDGELIAGPNHYSVFPHSLHPSGVAYTWVNPWRWPPPEVDPVECGFVPKSLPILSRSVPYPLGLEEAREWIWDTSGLADAVEEGCPAAAAPTAVDLAIAKTLPIRPGQRDLQVLEFVRALRRAGVQSPEQGERHLRTWWELAYSNVRTKRFDVTLSAFRRAWAKFDPALDRLEAAIARARQAAPPLEVVGVYLPAVMLLASLCRELQRAVGPFESFFLSRQDAARAISIRHPRQAGRYLELLRGDGLLRRVHAGVIHRNPSLRKAARWAWTGSR